MSSILSRREFLKRSSAVSVVGSAAPWAVSLAAMGEAAAQSATDYKAIVCVFLFGGNDYGNTVIPYSTADYNVYSGLRGAVALGRDTLTATALTPTTPLPNSLQYALAPGLSDLSGLFANGRLGVLLNVGNLREPTTKAQYTSKSVPLPPKLFSHNDQQSMWQSSKPEGALNGWGGRMGDLFAAGNGKSTFTCISVTGNTVYLSGQSAVQYQVSTNGSVPVNGIKNALFGSAAASLTLKNLISATSSDLFANEHAKVAARSISANEDITAALATTTPLTTVFPANNSLGNQLKMVARLIQARNTLAAKRQVFFVSLGGFDNHDTLLTNHPGLMTSVGQALAAFNSALLEIPGLDGKITTFTASDFGRTITSNGNGSDHGWGSHHFVMGGAVKGNEFYGKAPVLANGGPDDVGQGRLLPTTSVDQFAATLATWFGVSDADRATVLPQIDKFTVKDLGFLRPT